MRRNALMPGKHDLFICSVRGPTDPASIDGKKRLLHH